MSHRFTTATGQTGPDAYIFEAAAIANAQRQLDRRAARLAQAMATELPADSQIKVSIATDTFPDAFLVSDHDSTVKVLGMMGMAQYADDLADYARAIANPNHVVKS